MSDRNVQLNHISNRERWKPLWQRCVGLHADLQEFCYLFSDSGPRIALMNSTAPAFFYSLQGLMWQDMILKICKITDPGQSCGKSNLCLESLIEECAPNNTEKAVELVRLAREAAEFARDWRHRLYAHDDLDLAIKPETAQPLSIANIALVREALSKIAAVLDNCDPAGGQTFWTPAPHAKGAKSLLLYLQMGQFALKQNRQACERGDMEWGKMLPERI